MIDTRFADRIHLPMVTLGRSESAVRLTLAVVMAVRIL